MNNIKNWDNFNERLHVNGDVKHITNIIYNKIYQLTSNLILKGEITINNLLEKNSSRIKFKEDKIVIKLGNNHGAIKEVNFNNGVLEGLVLELTIKLSKEEFKNKYLIGNRIKETINHEVQHIIEIFHTGGNPPKSWDFNKRLKNHEKRFIEYCKLYNIDPQHWLNILHIFYLCEEHEIRSNVSSIHDYFKNLKRISNDIENDVKNRKEYKDYKIITLIKPKLIIENMFKIYTFFNSFLEDFIKNVIINQNNDLESVFIKEFEIIKRKASDSCKKMMSASTPFVTEHSRDLIDPKILLRDMKINLILDKK